jgi:ATP-binding cassette, subfamily B, bacterial
MMGVLNEETGVKRDARDGGSDLGLLRCIVKAMRMAIQSSRWLFIGSLVAVMIAAIGPSAQLATVRVLVDGVVDRQPRADLVVVATVLVVIVLTQRLAGLAMDSLLGLARDRTAASAVADYLDKAARLDAGHLHDSEFLDRMRRAADAADTRFSSVIFGVVGLIGGLTGLVALTGLLAAISPGVAVLVVASMVPWVLAEHHGYTVVRRTHAALAARRRQQSYLRTLMTEGDGALELLASDSGTAISHRHRALTEEILRLERPAHIRRFVTIAIGNLAGGALLIAAFAWAAFAAVDGDASAGDTAAVVGALGAFLFTTSNLANSISGLLQHGPYLADYFAFLASTNLLDRPASPARLELSFPPAPIIFDNVTFTYPGASRAALRDVSFRAEPGELIALVGENGAGKSTLIKLLLRFFDPESGSISIAGTDLRRCDPAVLRQHCGVVFQDYARYQFTVRDAVAMGRPQSRVDDAAVWNALAAAGLHDHIRSLDDGIDNQLGRLFPGGQDLSGGQWQRLALARLFYRQADILILDEPTSALDPRSEETIFAQLRAQLGARVGIVSSHRFSTVRGADCILVLHEGEIAEIGAHRDLLSIGGRYAQLFEKQAAAYR